MRTQLVFAVAAFAKRAPFLEFTEEDGSKCTIVKTGKVLSSTDCALEGTDDTLSGRVSTLRTAVDNLGRRMTNAETDLEGLKQPQKCYEYIAWSSTSTPCTSEGYSIITSIVYF